MSEQLKPVINDIESYQGGRDTFCTNIDYLCYGVSGNDLTPRQLKLEITVNGEKFSKTVSSDVRGSESFCWYYDDQVGKILPSLPLSDTVSLDITLKVTNVEDDLSTTKSVTQSIGVKEALTKSLEEGDLSVSDTTVSPDESVVVTLTLINNSDAGRTGYVDLLVDGSVRESKSLNVYSNSSNDVRFDVTFRDIGDYEVCCELTKTEV